MKAIIDITLYPRGSYREDPNGTVWAYGHTTGYPWYRMQIAVPEPYQAGYHHVRISGDGRMLNGWDRYIPLESHG